MTFPDPFREIRERRKEAMRRKVERRLELLRRPSPRRRGPSQPYAVPQLSPEEAEIAGLEPDAPKKPPSKPKPRQRKAVRPAAKALRRARTRTPAAKPKAPTPRAPRRIPGAPTKPTSVRKFLSAAQTRQKPAAAAPKPRARVSNTIKVSARAKRILARRRKK